MKAGEILLTKSLEQDNGRGIREIDGATIRAHWDGDGCLQTRQRTIRPLVSLGFLGQRLKSHCPRTEIGHTGLLPWC